VSKREEQSFEPR